MAAGTLRVACHCGEFCLESAWTACDVFELVVVAEDVLRWDSWHAVLDACLREDCLPDCTKPCYGLETL